MFSEAAEQKYAA